MPNIVPVLDASRTYFYCPMCQKLNNEKVEMKRDGHLFKCALGHLLDLQALQSMSARGNAPEMIPLQVQERPSENAVKREVWVNQHTWEILQHKFEGRFLVTIGTFFDNLADDSILFITGEDAKKLRDLGFKNGKEMAVLAERQKELEEQLDRQSKVIEAVKPMLVAAGITELF